MFAYKNNYSTSWSILQRDISQDWEKHMYNVLLYMSILAENFCQNYAILVS